MNRHPLAVFALVFAPLVLADHGTGHDPFTGGSIEAGAAKAAVCAACHGPAGNGAISPEWPKLAGQNAGFTVKHLKAFKSGTRKNPVMQAQVANLGEADFNDLAAYFAAQKPVPGVASKEAIALAEPLYRAGDAKRGITACAGCHGPTGAGNAAARYPQIAGQNAAYTASALKAYRAGERTTGPMMLSLSAPLTDAEIAALASYIAGLQ